VFPTINTWYVNYVAQGSKDLNCMSKKLKKEVNTTIESDTLIKNERSKPYDVVVKKQKKTISN
jgi:hypothetical protein